MPREIKVAKSFVKRIKQLSIDRITPSEAILMFDPSPKDVEVIMRRRVANFKKPSNAPLIIETFM